MPGDAATDNLLNHPVEISSTLPDALRCFQEGILLTFGFDNAEAIRSFYSAEVSTRSLAASAGSVTPS